MNELPGPWKAALTAVFFPLLFQDKLLAFAWGGSFDPRIDVLKRLFLLLPAAAVVLACWATGPCLVSLVVRHKRGEFFAALLSTWWDLGKAIFAFWGGIFKFGLLLLQTTFAYARLAVMGIAALASDLLLYPFRVIRLAGESAMIPGVPWIAVALTGFWTLLEATIFTFVTSPLVIDTLSNMTGDNISEHFIRVPLFLFMMFIVLGSYSVLLTLADAVASRDVPGIIKVGIIECVAMFVEVVFLYREFVDALVPWFAQHSKGFDLGVTGTLVIAGFTWLGIRSLSWFLFASSGTPVIMAAIQGRGLKHEGGKHSSRLQPLPALQWTSLERIRKEFDWVNDRGDELLGAFLLPPLQLLAAAINFCMLFATAYHLFDLPLDDIKKVLQLKPSLRSAHD